MLRHLHWDDGDDWLALDSITGATEASATRVASPAVPYRGAEGKFQNAWTAGSGTVSVYGELVLTPARRLTYVAALRLETLAWGGTLPQTRRGPLLVKARNAAAADLGMRAALQVTRTAAGALQLSLLDASSGSTSVALVDVRARADAWLLFRLEAESSGTVAPYRVAYTCTVVECRGVRERVLAVLTVPSPATDAYDFQGVGLGFQGLSKPADTYLLHVDELRAATGEDAPLPPPRRGGADRQRLTLRLRRYDAVAGEWRVAWDLSAADVRSLECTFLPHRVEESARVSLQDRGGLLAGKVQDLLRDLEQHVGASYRLDVLVPAGEVVDPSLPAGHVDDPVFWSGVVSARSFKLPRAQQLVEIEAFGWTSALERTPIELAYWPAGTSIDQVVRDLHAQVAAAWPGSLYLEPDDDGSLRYDGALPADLTFRATTAAEALSAVAGLGSFFFGVGVAGYPLDPAQEFRLLFQESRGDLRSVAPATAAAGPLADYVWRTIDLEDPLVTDGGRELADDDVPNRFLFQGAPLALDVRSTPSVDPTGTTFRDVDVYDFAAYAGAPFVGFQDARLRWVGLAFGPGDTIGTTQYPAGVVQPVDETLREPATIAAATRNSAAYTDFTLTRTLPSTTVSDGRLVYELDGGTIQAQLDLPIATEVDARESRTRVIVDPAVRGTYLAALRAHRELWAAARNARAATLVRRGELGPAGDLVRNRVAVLDGTTRVTRYGTVPNGGDAWSYGADDRPLGLARYYEVRQVVATYAEGGWEFQYSLGAAPRELSTRVDLEAR